MKDGVYSIRLTIDGRQIVARGEVRDGVFRGLGDLEGIVGVFSTNGMRARTDESKPDFATAAEGVVGDTAWTRVPLEAGGSASDRAGDDSLDDRLRSIGAELDRIGPLIRAIAAASVAQRETAMAAVARRADLHRDAYALMEHFAIVRDSMRIVPRSSTSASTRIGDRDGVRCASIGVGPPTICVAVTRSSRPGRA